MQTAGVSAQATDIASGTDWVLDADGKLTITSDAGMTDWTSNGRKDNKDKVISVDIGNGVTTIQEKSFYECDALISVSIADGVTSIGKFAFSGSRNLAEIIIPGSVTKIEYMAFMMCEGLKSVTMQGNTPTELGESVFGSCKFVEDGAKGIKVPAGCVETYRNAWTDWADYIADEKISLGDLSVSGTGWTIEKGKLTILSDAGMDDWMRSKDIGVTGATEADEIKYYCHHVITAELKSGVTYIKGESTKGAFTECNNMQSITIPDTVKSIGTYAFDRCSNLTEITIPSGVTTIENYTLIDCSSLETVTIPDTVTSIGASAFNSCSSLTKLEIPSGVTSIGSSAFSGCSSLTEITIPEGVTSIGNFTFQNCGGLTSIAIPSKVTSIGGGAFKGCGGLTEITIPAGVTEIGQRAFMDCSSLESVTMQGSTPPALKASEENETLHFENCKFVTDNKQGIKVPAGTLETYKTAWTEWKDYIEEYSGSGDEGAVSGTGWTLDADGKLTIMSNEGMRDWAQPRITGDAWNHPYQDRVRTVVIQNGVEFISDKAFMCCSNLTSAEIPDSVTEIGIWAFIECKSLTGITIPDSVTKIGESAFQLCNSLTSITIPDGVTKIEPLVFSECRNLTTITIPDGVTEIGIGAFNVCSSLTKFRIPDSVTKIGQSAFASCYRLTSITIPSSVTKIGEAAFRGCGALESVTMQGATPPELGETTIYGAVFESCKFVRNNQQGIKVPVGTLETYKTEWAEWKEYITEYNASEEDAKKVEAAKKAVEEALAEIRVSNATTKESLGEAMKNALEKAGIDSSDITITVEGFTRTDATADAEGSIVGNITITSGSESASVPVNKTIDRLPGAPADKVAAVKAALAAAVQKAVEEALRGTEVTNDNAEETAKKVAEEILPEVLQDAIEEALKEAGVNPGDVTIDTEHTDITVTPAVGDSEGSIAITIPVTSTEDGTKSDSAEIRVTIAKPGGSGDPDKDAEEAQKAAEEALKGMKVTNETTEEDILKALEGAYDKGTVDGIEEFEKTSATEEAPGSIKVKIRLTINGKTIYVTVSLTIAKLDKKTGVYVRFTDYYSLGEDSVPCYKYTGTAIKPAVEVYNNETLLIPGKDYTVGYRNNTKVGSTAALTVKGKGNFSGTSNLVNFTIINADIDLDTKHPTEMTVAVNTKVAPVIMNGTKKLTAKDYRLEGDGLVNSKYATATAEGVSNTLTVTGIGSYAGSSFEIKVKVVERSAAKKFAVAVDKNFKPVYNGSALDLSALFKRTQDGEGAVTVTDSRDKTKVLQEGTDFMAVCTSSLSNAGTVKFTLTGMGEYTGSVSKTFKISPLKVTDSSKFSVTFDEDKAYEYKASGATVDSLVVKYLGETDTDTDDRTLTEGVDYKVTYSNNKKVSGQRDASFKITFLGNYKGSSALSRTFKVVTAKLSAANTKVTVPDKVYSKAGRTYKSTPIVTVDGVTIKASSYTVSYAWATALEAGDDTKYVPDNRVKVTIAEGDEYAKVKVTITPKETGSYGLAEGAVLEGEYYVRKAGSATNLSRAKVTFHNKAGTQLKSLEYNGSTFYTPAGNDPEAADAPEDANAVYVRVTVGGKVVAPELYDVAWTNATAKGRATVVISGKGITTEKGAAVGSKNQAVSIKAMGLRGKTLKSYMEKAANAVNSFKNMLFKMQ